MLRSSYSQAAAYVAVFYCFDYDRQKICTYLIISDGVLMRRVSADADHVRTQPSLFDHTERISADFRARKGKQYTVREEQCYQSTQLGWQFDRPASAG